MNENESSFFKVDTDYIEISSKLRKRYQTYHSKESKMYTKTCNNIIKYHTENKKNIGIDEIKYFFKYNKKIYACIQKYDITDNDFFLMSMVIIIQTQLRI